MDLSEAKIILNDNGYELLDEGKLGRAIGMGALALGTLFGNAHADNNYNFFNKVLSTETFDQENELDCDDVFYLMGKNANKIISDADVDNFKCYREKSDYISIIDKQRNNFIGLDDNYNLKWQINKSGNKITNLDYDKNGNISDLEVYYKNGNTIKMWYDNADSETADTSFVKITDKNGNGMVYMVDNYVIDDENIDFNPDEEKIIFECPLKNGKQNGKGYTYDEDGNLSQEDTYVNGKRNGKTIGYFSDGTEAFKIQYKDGKQVGHMVCSDGSRGRNITCYHP